MLPKGRGISIRVPFRPKKKTKPGKIVINVPRHMEMKIFFPLSCELLQMV